MQAASDDPPPRPAWQWSLFGAGLIGLAWLVLALLAAPVGALIVRANLGPWSSPEELQGRIAAAAPAVVGRMALENMVLEVLVVGAANVAGGFVVGRWGPRRGVAQAAVAGVLVSLAAIGVAAATEATADLPAGWALLVIVPCASSLAALGGWWGGRAARR